MIRLDNEGFFIYEGKRKEETFFVPCNNFCRNNTGLWYNELKEKNSWEKCYPCCFFNPVDMCDIEEVSGGDYDVMF